MSPETEFWRIVGFPFTTTDGTPLRRVESRRGRIVGLSDETVCNHDPSMNRIEPGPKSDNPEIPDRIVRDEVWLWRSTTKGSNELVTPRTYVGVLLCAAAK